MAPVKLPRYVMFKGDNGNNLCYADAEGHPYLFFNSTNRDLWGTHEVIPLSGTADVVTIKSLYNLKWWRRSPNWIWADQDQMPGASHRDCHFKVVQLSPNKVALQNLGNSRYVKRFTHEGKTSALNAAALDHSNDVYAQMEVSEAISSRRVFDVEYVMDLVNTTDTKPLALGRTSNTNNSSFMTDLSLTVSYEIKEKSTWSDSTTFTTGLSVTVTAGIPDVSSVSGTVSTESSTTTEMGKENEKTITLSSTINVKDVPPGAQVSIEVSGTEAMGTVPYKYKYQNTRVDGLTMPVDTGVDGFFKGVNVVNIVGVVTDGSGTRKTIALEPDTC